MPPPEPDAGDPGRERSAPEVPIGEYLARQRRLRGVSLDELASLTKIPRRSLERLEDGAFDRQVDGFARGFVRTVAQALGLDAEEAVMRLLGEPASGDEDLAVRRVSLRRWALGAALVLAGATAIFGLWSLWSSDAPAPEAAASAEVIYRRDVVRELAEFERAFGDPEKSLDSERAEPSDRSADTPLGRFR